MAENENDIPEKEMSLNNEIEGIETDTKRNKVTGEKWKELYDMVSLFY